MSVNKFEQIKNFVHTNGNQSCQEKCIDKLYKLRSLIDYSKKKFMQIKPMETLWIDEKMVPFKGKSALKQSTSKSLKVWEINCTSFL